MKEILSGAIGNGAGSVVNRTSARVVSAIAKYRKTGSGSCTLTIHDGVTGASLHEFTVAADDPDGDAQEIALPSNYYAEVSAESGTFALTVWMDGDA